MHPETTTETVTPATDAGDLFAGEADALATAIGAGEEEAAPKGDEPKADEKKSKTEEKPKADEKKAEPEPEPEKKDEQKPPDRIASARAALARREAQLVERTTRAREAEATLKARETTLAERETEARTVQARANDVYQEAQRDPLAFVEKHLGITRVDLARRILHDGKPSAEEIARQAAKDAETKGKSEVEKLREELRLERQRQSAAAAQADAERAFVTAAKAEDKYPILSALDEQELVDMGNREAERLAKAGKKATFDQLLEYLEWRESKKYEKITSRKQVSSASDKRDSDRTETKVQESGNGHQGKKAEASSTSPTLSTRATSERQTIPKDILEMDPDEERAFLIRTAEAARK